MRQIGFEETMFDTGPFGGPTHTINAVFVAELDGDVPLKTDDQHEEFRWFSELPADLYPYVKKYIVLAKTLI